jgi:hypothetical protein
VFNAHHSFVVFGALGIFDYLVFPTQGWFMNALVPVHKIAGHLAEAKASNDRQLEQAKKQTVIVAREMAARRQVDHEAHTRQLRDVMHSMQARQDAINDQMLQQIRLLSAGGGGTGGRQVSSEYPFNHPINTRKLIFAGSLLLIAVMMLISGTFYC